MIQDSGQHFSSPSRVHRPSRGLFALIHEKNVRPMQDLVAFFKKQSKAGRIILGTFFIAMWVIASTKPGDGGGNGGGEGGGGDGGTNNIQMVIGPGISPERREPCEARSLEGCGLQPLDLPEAVTNSQQQGLQSGIQPPQGGMVGRPRACHGPVDRFHVHHLDEHHVHADRRRFQARIRHVSDRHRRGVRLLRTSRCDRLHGLAFVWRGLGLDSRGLYELGVSGRHERDRPSAAVLIWQGRAVDARRRRANCHEQRVRAVHGFAWRRPRGELGSARRERPPKPAVALHHAPELACRHMAERLARP